MYHRSRSLQRRGHAPTGPPDLWNLVLPCAEDAADDFDGSGLPAHLDVDPQEPVIAVSETCLSLRKKIYRQRDPVTIA